DDAAFDRVLSTFGHMLAPRHRRAAEEMARVCRPGGAIAFCTWKPDGTVGAVFRMMAAHLPAPPPFASSPIAWGTPEYVREMFADLATGFEFEDGTATIEWESPEAFTA